MKPLITLWIFLFAIASCNKDDNSNDSNNNIVSGTITITGRAPQTFTAVADSTMFMLGIDYSTHDTTYDISARFDVGSGSNKLGELTITFIKVYPPGTYDFDINQASRGNPTRLSYREIGGDPYSNIDLGTTARDSTGKAYTAGTFTIIKMTRKEIEGTIHTSLADMGGVKGVVQNLSFKGTYR